MNAPIRRITISESPDYYGASLVLMTGIASVEPPEAPAEAPPAPAAAPTAGGRMASVMRYLGLRDDTTPVAPVSPSQRADSPLARRGGRDPGGR